MGRELGRGRGKERNYRECISATTLSSFSTAAIFSAEVGWGLPKPRKDMLEVGFMVFFKRWFLFLGEEPDRACG